MKQMVRRVGVLLGVGVPLSVLAGIGASAPTSAPQITCASAPPHTLAWEASVTPRSPTPTSVSMRNVIFRLTGDIQLHIRRLDGTMTPLHGPAVDFDDKTSYATNVKAAEVSMGGPALSHLLNDCVFGYKGAPLRNLKINTAGDELEQSGILHKGVDIPFTMKARPRLDSIGEIRLSPTSMKIFGVNGMALMKALGLSLQKMIDVSGAKGVHVRGNDLFLDALAILPPPVIRGRLSALRIEGEELVQTFGAPGDTARSLVPPDTSVHDNYMYYRGGMLHFAKLFMPDADMLVVDADPRDPFDFYNDKYQRQLAAGYSKTLTTLGLEVYMPDYDKLPTAPSSRSVAARAP